MTEQENNTTDPTPQDSPEEKLNKLEAYLTKQRDDWGGRIIELVKTIKDVDQLIDGQIKMLSYRQMIVDQMARIGIRLKKYKSSYDRSYKARFISYFNYDYRLNDKQKENFVTADLSITRQQIGYLESQLDFYRESVRTLDQMGWAIKNRIQINEI